MDWREKWAWQKRMAWIHKEKKIAYMNIGKCASGSLKKTLETVGFARSNEYTCKDNYFNFTIIREPIDRFSSGFLSIVGNESRKKSLSKKYNQFIFDADNIKDLTHIFIGYIGQNGFFDDHILPQVYTISDSNDKLYRIDLFILFERLKEDFYKIKEIVKESALELMYLNPISRYHHYPFERNGRELKEIKKDIHELILKDTTLLNKIKILYADDFKLYNKVKNLI